MKYRHQGREKSLSLGTYPEVALAKARDRRDEARKLIAGGMDPLRNLQHRDIYRDAEYSPEWQVRRRLDRA